MVKFGRLAAAVLAGTMAFGATAARAGALGHGELVGTWNLQNPSPYDNPTSNADSVNDWGTYILATDPGAFDIDAFHLAGATSGWNGDVTNGALSFHKVDGQNGDWTYNGGVNGGAAIDLYLAVKYATVVSVFFYDHVLPGDGGQITSDPKVYFGLPSEPDSDYCDVSAANDYFNSDCIAFNNGGQVANISHVIGYWPPDEVEIATSLQQVAETPEPATLALLSAGLLGLGMLRRRRK